MDSKKHGTSQSLTLKHFSGVKLHTILPITEVSDKARFSLNEAETRKSG